MTKQKPQETYSDETSTSDTADLTGAGSPASLTELLSLTVSGTYAWPLLFPRERLRLDVDGPYPQMVVSGSVRAGASRVNWIAHLTATGPDSWTGPISYKDGPVASFLYTNVAIHATRNIIPPLRSVTATFSGGAPNRVRTYRFSSRSFHDVNFEFDFQAGVTPLTSINTGDHPNRPASLPVETLTIQKVYRRAGFEVETSSGGSVPLSGAGVGAQWSNNEMHDAMQIYWSHFAAKAQWAFWTFFAAQHEMGTSLGGIMFDDIGPQQRQGTALFLNSFIAVPPAGDLNPAAWVRRMIFWTACHEMGHAFNLAHSWQKSLVFGGHGPWIPLADEPEARSFMNYPYNVLGGQTAFFSNFEFRFSDGELLFMRHAPERFVEQGAALWFDNHGFEEANTSPEPALKLELRINREKADFEFMEPAVLELKLTNISSEPQIIPENILAMQDSMTIIVKRNGEPARQFLPYARYCFQRKNKVLGPGEKVYESLFPAAGREGWSIAEPGYYKVQVALHLGDEDLVSNPLTLRVAPPRGYDEEFIAQDFFSDDVGRILAFDGSRSLNKGNDVLREVADRFSDRKVAIHALVPLGTAMAKDYKLLNVEHCQTPNSAAQAGGDIKMAPADTQQANKDLNAALGDDKNAAAETLGHIDYKYYVDQLSDSLVAQGERKEAAAVEEGLYNTLSARNVLDSVLQEIKSRRNKAATAAAK
jgi:hypothetical protein